MKTVEQLRILSDEVLQVLYAKASPPLDFKKARSEKKLVKDWFTNYYLSKKEEQKITKAILKKYKLTISEKHAIEFDLFNYGPNNTKKGDFL